MIAMPTGFPAPENRSGQVLPLLGFPAEADVTPPPGYAAIRERTCQCDGGAALGRVAAIGQGVDRRLLGRPVLLPPRRADAPLPPLRRVEDLHLLPDDLEGLNPGLAEDLALACRAVRCGRVARGDRLRIFGAGRVATMTARVAGLEGAKLCDTASADVVFAAEGRPADIPSAIRAAAPGCRLVLLAPRAPLPSFDLGTLLALEIDLIGCGAPEADDYETALALLAFRDVAAE